jgi:Na+-driven multidrug efflux pump
VYLILSVVLVGPLGIIGVALATLISVALLGCFVTTVRACQAYQIPIWRFHWAAIMPSVLPALVQWLTLHLFSQVRTPANLFELALHGSVSFAAYAIAFRLLSLTADERVVANRWESASLRRLRDLYREQLATSETSDSIASISEEAC